MGGSLKLTVALAIAALVPLASAYLRPNCTGLVHPGCTTNLLLVTDKLPRCPEPFDVWLAQGRFVEGNMARPNGLLPPWYNRALARRGQQATKEFRYPWYAVVFYGLFIELAIPDITYPLIFNGVHETRERQAARDIATLVQSLVWIGDEFRRIPNMGKSSYLRSVDSTRNIHIEVMNKAANRVATTGCLVNQYDTTYTSYNSSKQNFWNAFNIDLNNSTLTFRKKTIAQHQQCPPATGCGGCQFCTGCQHYQDGWCLFLNFWQPWVCPVSYINCYTCYGCTSCPAAEPRCRYNQPSQRACGGCQGCSIPYQGCWGCGGCANNTDCMSTLPALFNQQAMNLVVFNLVAFPMCYPEESGMNWCEKDRMAFLHFWASSLYGLGVEDRWNILIQPDLQTACDYFERVFKEMLVPGLFNIDAPTKRLMDQVLAGLEIATAGTLTPEVSMYRFLVDFLRIPAPEMEKTMNPAQVAYAQALAGSYRPQFLQDEGYRNLVNTFVSDFSFFSSNAVLMGACSNFTRSSADCFVKSNTQQVKGH